MAVKVIIKRKVPESHAREMIPLFRKMRAMAMNQEGYIAGETLRNMNDPEDFIVISNWQSSDHWVSWLESADRRPSKTRSTTCWADKRNTKSTITDFRSNRGCRVPEKEPDHTLPDAAVCFGTR